VQGLYKHSTVYGISDEDYIDELKLLKCAGDVLSASITALEVDIRLLEARYSDIRLMYRNELSSDLVPEMQEINVKDTNDFICLLSLIPKKLVSKKVKLKRLKALS